MRGRTVPIYIPEKGFSYALEAKSARWDANMKVIRPTIAMGEWLVANCEDDWLLTKSDVTLDYARHTPQYKTGRWDGRAYQVNFVSERDAALFKMFFL